MQGLLVRGWIVVACVTDTEVKDLISQGGIVIADGKEWDAKAFAKRIALVKAIREYGLRKANYYPL